MAGASPGARRRHASTSWRPKAAADQFQCRSAMHAEPFSHYDRRFPIRSGTQSIPIGGGLEGLTQWELTLAEVLSGVGYATAHFGKWHLGSEQGRLPNDQGFDEWYGIPRTTDEAFWPSESAVKAAGVS